MQGVRYDAYTLTKADGKGKWWDGLDPQKLYTGRNIVMPDGFTTIAAANQWHEANDRPWNEGVPAMDPGFAEKWFLRCQDLVDTYDADLLYFDDTELPLGQYGIDLVTHYYNSSVRKHGKVDVVVTAKDIKPEHVGSVTLDIERGKANGILAQPWQSDTCIGNWYYQRSLFDTHKYKTPTFVIHSLIDIVSRNGNLLLSIPLRGDGTIDEDEHTFLTEACLVDAGAWRRDLRHPPLQRLRRRTADAAAAGTFNEKRQRPYTTEDIRFVTKGDALYAFAFVWPTDGKLHIKTLAKGSAALPRPVQRVELAGAGPIAFDQDGSGLHLTLPSNPPNPYAYAFTIHA